MCRCDPHHRAVIHGSHMNSYQHRRKWTDHIASTLLHMPALSKWKLLKTGIQQCFSRMLHYMKGCHAMPEHLAKPVIHIHFICYIRYFFHFFTFFSISANSIINLLQSNSSIPCLLYPARSKSCAICSASQLHSLQCFCI